MWVISYRQSNAQYEILLYTYLVAVQEISYSLCLYRSWTDTQMQLLSRMWAVCRKLLKPRGRRLLLLWEFRNYFIDVSTPELRSKRTGICLIDKEIKDIASEGSVLWITCYSCVPWTNSCTNNRLMQLRACWGSWFHDHIKFIGFFFIHSLFCHFLFVPNIYCPLISK